MGKHWLTIITITKDDPRGLARALESTRGFRALGAEHVVIDGGKDPAGAVELASRIDRGIRVQPLAPTGVSDAFNVGLGLAQGEWIWFLNGGDGAHESLDPAWLRVLLQSTKAQVVTGAVHFDGEDQPRRVPSLAYQWPLLACWLMHPTTMVRRERLQAVGGFDARWSIAMDYDFWFKVLDRGTAVDVLSVPFARFEPNGLSEHPASAGRKKREESAIVLRRSGSIAWSGVWLGLRIVRRLLWAAWFWLFPAGPLKPSR